MIDMPLSEASARIRRIAIGDFLYRSARKFGSRTALVDGDQRITYTELDARSSQFGHYLLKTFGAGKQIAMLCNNSIDMVIATNGIHKAGCIWAPVNIRLDVASIAYVLKHAEVSAVVVDQAILAQPGMAKMLQELGAPLVISHIEAEQPVESITLAQAEANQPQHLPEVEIDANQPALLMYTSGTTGNPKGVVHSHLGVYSAVLGNMGAFSYTEHDVLSGWLPLFHCAQHVLAATACASGSCVVLSRTFIPAEIAALIINEKISIFVGLPMMYGAVLADPNFQPTSLRQCVYAMAPIPKPLVEQIAKRMSKNIMLATGQTEIYPATLAFRPIENPGCDANYWGTSLITCETAIMDDEGNELARNEVGEIVHRGPNAMLGYFKDPVATANAQKFGWHHTGDLGMWDSEGRMVFFDRKKDMIKTGGENVASVKVEAILLAHPEVAAAAVFGVPHPRWSEAICALAVRKPGTTLDEEALLAHCRQHLGGFEVPKLIRFVDAFPSTATGKVQKHVLRSQFAQMGADLWGTESA